MSFAEEAEEAAVGSCPGSGLDMHRHRLVNGGTQELTFNNLGTHTLTSMKIVMEPQLRSVFYVPAEDSRGREIFVVLSLLPSPLPRVSKSLRKA